MTIGQSSRKAGPFAGDGVTVTFPFAFPVYSEDQIQVVLSTGLTTTTLSPGSYTTTLNSDQNANPGGSITYPISGAALSADYTIAIIGNTPYTQPLSLPSGGNFNPTALEKTLDTVVMQTQQLKELLDRTLTLPPGETGSAAIGEPPEARAGGYLYFNATGAPVVAKIAPPVSPVQPVVNVKEFGATGDGVADDTPAVQTALNWLASGGGTLFVPGGTYRIGTDVPLVVPAGVVVSGSGAKTVFKKTSGTADIFFTSANNTGFRDFKMEGPNNTGCDGIVLDAGATGCVIERIEGYQLASTVTCGVASDVYDVVISHVRSVENTQQGIHLNKAKRCLVSGCSSFSIGSSGLHHGMYVGNCADITVDNFYADNCFGFGLHVYAQGAGVIQNNIKIAAVTAKNNGRSTATTRGGVFVGNDGVALTKNVVVEQVFAEGNRVHNFAVDGNWDNIWLKGLVLSGDSGDDTTQNGLFVGSNATGSRNIFVTDFIVSGHPSNGIRISISNATVDSFLIERGLLKNNASGIYATGSSVSGTIEIGDLVKIVSSPLSGTFAGRTKGTNFYYLEQSISETFTFTRNSPNVLFLEPTGGPQYVYANPGPAPFPAGWPVFVKNTSSTNNLYFDPYGINFLLGPSVSKIFIWTGTAWSAIG